MYLGTIQANSLLGSLDSLPRLYHPALAKHKFSISGTFQPNLLLGSIVNLPHLYHPIVKWHICAKLSVRIFRQSAAFVPPSDFAQQPTLRIAQWHICAKLSVRIYNKSAAFVPPPNNAWYIPGKLSVSIYRQSAAFVPRSKLLNRNVKNSSRLSSRNLKSYHIIIFFHRISIGIGLDKIFHFCRIKQNRLTVCLPAAHRKISSCQPSNIACTRYSSGPPQGASPML